MIKEKKKIYVEVIGPRIDIRRGKNPSKIICGNCEYICYRPKLKDSVNKKYYKMCKCLLFGKFLVKDIKKSSKPFETNNLRCSSCIKEFGK